MFIALLLATCSAVAQAEEGAAPSADALRRRVERLARDLGDDSREVRTGAEAELLKLGPAILDLLPEGDSQTDPNAKQALGRIRQKLELDDAKQAAEPSRVTLRPGAMPLGEVLAAIEKQTGNKIVVPKRLANVAAANVNVDFKNTPFWQAIDTVLDQAKLSVDSVAFDPETGEEIGEEGGRVLVLRPVLDGEAPRSRHAAYGGVFRFAPESVVARRNLRYENSSGLLIITVGVQWEPRIAPISLRHAASTLAVTLEAGKPLAAADADVSIQTPIAPGAAEVQLQFMLALPPRGAKTIGSFKATVSALMPGRETTFRFENLAQARRAQRQRGDVTMVLDEVRKNNALWEVRTRIKFGENAGDLESHIAWIYRSTATMLDRDGKPVEEASSEQYQTADGIAAVYLYELPDGLKKHVFTYRTPSALLKKDVVFQFKDLPLP